MLQLCLSANEQSYSFIPSLSMGWCNMLGTAFQEMKKRMNGGTGVKFGCDGAWFYWNLDHQVPGSFSICDSGIFTLLYGEMKGQIPDSELPAYFDKYTSHYIDYVNDWTGKKPYFVEIDAQDKIGLEKTEDLRKRLKDGCPNAEFIYVWHFSDGLDGWDRMVKKYEYVAIGGIAKIDREIRTQLCRYLCLRAKCIKPEIKIHLMGVSDIVTMEACSQTATTCDSSSWLPLSYSGSPDALDDFQFNEILNATDISWLIELRKWTRNPAMKFGGENEDSLKQWLARTSCYMYRQLISLNRIGCPQVLSEQGVMRKIFDSMVGNSSSSWNCGKFQVPDGCETHFSKNRRTFCEYQDTGKKKIIFKVDGSIFEESSNLDLG